MLVGLVTVIQDSGLVITILACDQGPRRDFDGLKLTVNFFTSGSQISSICVDT